MPGCAAVGCSNRSEKGYIMKCFPRNPTQRQIWQERIARADWVPSRNSFLCHVHFDPQQWAITQSGRIRLRKNAVPTIFHKTSYRKSVRKRVKSPIDTTDYLLPDDFSIENLVKQAKHSSTGYSEEDSPNFHHMEVSQQLSLGSAQENTRDAFMNSMENKVEKTINKLDGKNDSDMQPEIIVLSDSDEDLSVLVQDKSDSSKLKDNGAVLTVPKTQNQKLEPTQTPVTVIKEEVKSESVDHNILNDSYDEIEERLKQICDGGSSEDGHLPKLETTTSTSKTTEEKLKIAVSTTSTTTKPNNDTAKRNESGGVSANKEENLKIIFGAESGDEKGQACKTISPNNASLAIPLKVDDHPVPNEPAVPTVIKEEKNFSEDIEENFTKDEVHVIPNMKAAMKRKRRTREEIMKSIKKSIKSTSDQEFNTTNTDSSDTSLDIEDGNDISMSSSILQDTDSNRTTERPAKFVIKVTGDPSDVIEIMDELSHNAIISEKGTSAYSSKENDEFVTSTITVYSPMNSKESYITDCKLKYESTTSSKMLNSESINLEPISNYQFPVHRHSSISCDEDHRNSNISDHLHFNRHGTISPLAPRSKSIPQDYESLVERLEKQEKVIAQLTDQLIIYKELESNTRNKTTKDGDTALHKINTRTSMVQVTPYTKKSLETKQRLIDDLSNRITYFEEMNKKLMKTVTLESQQKRKLEAQMKQKDSRIKELNWKLEKASKFLERSEKNTNTYRRKMLNMQTIMRRKKLLDEKMSKFNEMFADSTKQDFSEKDLTMAVEIRKTCGKAGYDKLLSYGFPLPPLSAIRKMLPPTEYSYYNQSVVEKVQSVSSRDIKTEKTEGEPSEKMDIEANLSDTKPPIHAVKKGATAGVETVTGTVQDIFNENNDGEDFSTNELREHFILQLNAVM